ncbi:MAG: ABC transporter permease subunit [Acholeplasmatales bacterium]|nr:ABC transporter permease subunit [Acholeplasmatales bacterium]
MKNRLFSKALFKQSCKANGIMWIIITSAVCFMLACVMLISGTSNISQVKEGVQNTIIEEIITSEIKKTSVNLYNSALDSELLFDTEFVKSFNELNTEENALKLKEIKAKAVADSTLLVTEKVTEKVTNEVTNRLTKEINDRVESEKTQIEAEVATNVASDMTTTEAQNKVLERVSKGESVTDATNAVIAEYTEIEKTKVVNEHIEAAKADIITDTHKAQVADLVLTELKEQFTNESKLELKNELAEIENNAKAEITEYIKTTYITPSYTKAIQKIEAKYPNSGDTKEAYGISMVTINPNHQVDSEYTKNSESIPNEYIDSFTDYMLADINSWDNGKKTNTLEEYVNTQERINFRYERAYNSTSMIIAANLSSKEYKEKILNTLKAYKVNEEQYNEMGFDYKKVHNISYEGMMEFQNKYDYEISNISDDIKNDNTKYTEEKNRIHDELYLSVAGSLLDKLPQNVSDGIQELGTMDLYGLIVGSIFYKMAGLLLPIIYVIMVSNSLIAGQVDTGSMAYVLSTSTRRNEVTFTQAIFLVLSLFLMFVCTTITSIVCFAIANVNTDLTYGKLILINLSAFIVLFAISGINYLTSCYFDRSKKAMALGGGLSMFFLVATMLGLFGSPVIPSVVRISALNNFNYVSIISLFDVVSILNGEYAWIWKISILVVIGIIGYIFGALKFKKKDLPL